MQTLIEALQIFLKYGNPSHPTHCEHDVLMVVGYELDDFSQEDRQRLHDLSFFWNDNYDCWMSYRFGSA